MPSADLAPDRATDLSDYPDLSLTNFFDQIKEINRDVPS